MTAPGINDGAVMCSRGSAPVARLTMSRHRQSVPGVKHGARRQPRETEKVESYVTVAPIPPIPSVGVLTYRVPEEAAAAVVPGVRAIVPLGRRRVTGLVIARADGPPENVKCRDVDSVLDAEPVVPVDLLELCSWMASYYLAGLSEVLSVAIGRGLTTASKRLISLLDSERAHTDAERRLVAALAAAGAPLEPAALASRLELRSVNATISKLAERGALSVREVLAEPKVKARFETYATVARVPEEHEAAELFKRAPRRREIFEYLLERPARTATLAELSSLFAAPTTQLRVLSDAGLVGLERAEHYRQPSTAVERSPEIELSPEQRGAIEAVSAELGGFKSFLLQGVTASGKTEVYLRLIRTVLDRGQSALVLVPEISLTHQLLARLRGRFGESVAVLHSELSAGERWDQWRRIARGEARIAMGARSAVVAPLARLGLIVIDEEHDPSYKQKDGIRYHGRDVAVMRGQLADCPVILGSATPSLESWNNARQGRYQHLLLPQRVTANPVPSVEVVDLRGRDIIALGGLGEHLSEQLRKNFKDKGQSLLFLNRRGFANHLQCYECGELVECDACSVGMTVHKGKAELCCHHCDARRPLPRNCPTCGGDALLSQGLGTQRLEDAMRRLLPAARIARLDRDAAARKGRSGSILQDWKHHRVDVLIGTQMITKGHDVPGVTLVGIVHADLALGVPDFRAGERTFQLLTQVAGRAGRGQKRGRVILQTYQPEHPAIAAAAHHDFDGFATADLAERAELGYPPLARMVLMRFEGADRNATEGVALQAARRAAALARSDPELLVRGPAPSAIERVKGRYRYQLQLRGPNGASARRAAAEARGAVDVQARGASVRVLIDVDPTDML